MEEKSDNAEGAVETGEVAAGASAVDERKSQGRKGFWLLLVVFAAGAGFLVYNADRLQQLVPSRSSVQGIKPEPAPAPPKPVVRPQAPVAKAEKPVRESQPRAVPMPRDLATHDEVQGMLEAARALQQQLRQLGQEQRLIRQALEEQRRMDLRVRLRWITDPAARLPQMRLAWQEISLLPALDEQRRAQAVSMYQLAGSVAERLHRWQSAIGKWADSLKVPAHEDILPRPEHPWLAWIVGQFHLRQAPSAEARRLADLRQRLLDVGRMLTLEDWPDEAGWQQLRAELLLELGRHPHQGAIDLGLPEHFNEIRQDIETLRQVAQQWQETL